MSDMQGSPWAFSTIGEDLHLVNGFGFKPHQWKESGTPIVRIQNLNDPEARFDYIQHRVDERFLVKTGDLLFAWSGSRGTSFGPFIWNRGDAVLNQHIFNVRLKKPSIDKTFAFWWLKQLVGEIEQQAHGSAGLVHITRKELEKFRFPILDRLEQRKIARILTTLDSVIEKTEALIAKYQAIKQGMMHDLLTRGVDAHGHLRPCQTEAPDLYRQTELGWVPKGWEINRLADLTTRIVDGVHHTPSYVESGVPFVTVKNLTFGDSIDFTDINYITHNDHREFWKRADPSPGDVLVTKDGTLGVARIVPSYAEPFSIFVSVALLRPNLSRCVPSIIWLFFDSGAFLPQLGRLSAGTGLQHIHLEHFREFRLKTPPMPEQEEIVNRIEANESRLKHEGSYLRKLKAIRTGLMQDLLTGNVRVKVDGATEDSQ